MIVFCFHWVRTTELVKLKQNSTSYLSFILFIRIYQTLKFLNPGAKFLLCAPTGKAARRMKEALEITGLDAFTLHKKLGITAERLEPLLHSPLPSTTSEK